MFANLALAPKVTISQQCRSNPLIVLADGTIVDILADIDTWLTNVREVDYVVHIPVGAHPVLVISTPDWPNALEHFVVYADKLSGEFSSTITVQTAQGNASALAKLTINIAGEASMGLSAEAGPVSLPSRAF